MFGKLKEKLRKLKDKLKKEAQEIEVEEIQEKKFDEKIEEKQQAIEKKEIKEEKKEKEKVERKDIKTREIKKETREKTKEGIEEKKKEEIINESKQEDKEEEIKEEINKEVEEKEKEIKEEESKKKEKETEKKETSKKRFFFFFRKKKITEKAFNNIFDEIELDLLESNVALDVIDKLRQELKTALVDKTFTDKELETTIMNSLTNTLRDIFNQENIDLLELANKNKPLILAFFGINGTGKTTTIAKIAKYFLDHGKKVVLVASDTYRAASIEQLQHHADALGVKLIKHDYNADPAAVAFDAVQHAKAKNIDVVLIDTAGRMHNNKNLMNELKKLVRVVQPHLKIFVAEAVTGSDAVIQAETFNNEIGIDAIILTKMDVDEKGGTAISIAYTIKKPILFLGVGQEYKDLKRFDSEEFIKNILG